MQSKVEVAAEMGEERENMERGRYHRPEPIGYQRKDHRGTRAKEIDRKMSDVEACIFWWDEQVKRLVRCDHRRCYQGHRPLWPAPLPEGIADRHEHEDEEGRNAHPLLFSRSWLSVKRA